MPKFLVRIVALILIPCLLADPILATASTDFPTRSSSLSIEQTFLFDRQALSVTGNVFGGNDLTRAATVRLDQRASIAGGFSRRGFLLAGLSWIGLRRIKVAAQGDISPATPAQATQVRQDILTIFRESQNFKTEIDRMFDAHLLGSDLGFTREELHEAMQSFVDFIQTVDIFTTNDPRGKLSTDVLAKQFVFNPRYWESLKKFEVGGLFHEAVHTSRLHRSLFQQMRNAGETLASYGTVRPEDEARIRQEPNFRNAAWNLISTKFKSELQGIYLGAAFNASVAAGNGMSLRDYLIDRAKPLAAAAGVSPQTFLDRAQQLGFRAEPDAYLLGDQWSYSRYYHTESIGLDMEYMVFLVYMIEDPLISYLLGMYSQDPAIQNLLRLQSQRPNIGANNQLRLAQWAHETFLRNQPPDENPGVFNRYGLVLTIVGGIASSLALWQWRRSKKGPKKPSSGQTTQQRRSAGSKMKPGDSKLRTLLPPVALLGGGALMDHWMKPIHAQTAFLNPAEWLIWLGAHPAILVIAVMTALFSLFASQVFEPHLAMYFPSVNDGLARAATVGAYTNGIEMGIDFHTFFAKSGANRGTPKNSGSGSFSGSRQKSNKPNLGKRNFLRWAGLGLAATAGGGLYTWLKPSGIQPPPGAKERIQSYLDNLAHEWLNHPNPTAPERDWGKWVDYMRQHWEFVDIPGPIGIRPAFDKNDSFIIDPTTGLLQFKLLLHPKEFDEILQAANNAQDPTSQQLLRTFLRCFIVKEIGGLNAIRERPYVGRSLSFTYQRLLSAMRRLTQVLKSYPENLTPQFPATRLIRKYVAIYGFIEAAGYVQQAAYLAQEHISAQDLVQLSEQSSTPADLKAALETVAIFREQAGPEMERPLQKASAMHVLMTFNNRTNAKGSLPEQQLPIDFVLSLEGLEGRRQPGSRVPNIQLGAPLDPNLLPFLDDPDYYAPKPEDLEKEFANAFPNTTLRTILPPVALLGGGAILDGLMKSRLPETSLQASMFSGLTIDTYITGLVAVAIGSGIVFAARKIHIKLSPLPTAFFSSIALMITFALWSHSLDVVFQGRFLLVWLIYSVVGGFSLLLAALNWEQTEVSYTRSSKEGTRIIQRTSLLATVFLTLMTYFAISLTPHRHITVPHEESAKTSTGAPAASDTSTKVTPIPPAPYSQTDLLKQLPESLSLKTTPATPLGPPIKMNDVTDLYPKSNPRAFYRTFEIPIFAVPQADVIVILAVPAPEKNPSVPGESLDLLFGEKRPVNVQFSEGVRSIQLSGGRTAFPFPYDLRPWKSNSDLQRIRIQIGPYRVSDETGIDLFIQPYQVNATKKPVRTALLDRNDLDVLAFSLFFAVAFQPFWIRWTRVKANMVDKWNRMGYQLRIYWRHRQSSDDKPPRFKWPGVLQRLAYDRTLTLLAPLYSIPLLDIPIDILIRAFRYDAHEELPLNPFIIPALSAAFHTVLFSLLIYHEYENHRIMASLLWMGVAAVKYGFAPQRSSNSGLQRALYQAVVGLILFYPILTHPDIPVSHYVVPVIINFLISYLVIGGLLWSVSSTAPKPLPAAPATPSPAPSKAERRSEPKSLVVKKTATEPPRPLSKFDHLAAATVGLTARIPHGNATTRSHAVAIVIGMDQRFHYFLTSDAITQNSTLKVQLATPTLGKPREVEAAVVLRDPEKGLALIKVDNLSVPKLANLEIALLAPTPGEFPQLPEGAIVITVPHWSPKDLQRNHLQMTPLHKALIEDVLLAPAGHGGALVINASGQAIGLLSQTPQIPFPKEQQSVASGFIPMKDIHEFLIPLNVPGLSIRAPAEDAPPPVEKGSASMLLPFGLFGLGGSALHAPHGLLPEWILPYASLLTLAAGLAWTLAPSRWKESFKRNSLRILAAA